MTPFRKIRDPIHGFAGITKEESDLIDTSAFQRLRRIHQLAMAFLVYPGALHTRFDHTLGVLHVADRLCVAFGIDSQESRLIRLAALLHDIGHGPFSHVSETILDTLSPPDLKKKAGITDKIHELVTQKLILTHFGFNGILSSKDREEIVSLLHGRFGQRINHSILSGPLDADKQDYLLRDSYFCGVRYGIYDIAQLHNTFRAEYDGDDRILMVEPDGVHALEQFVLAKYYLTNQVYRHKVRLITDQMLIRAIRLGVEADRIGFLEDLYRFSDTEEFLSNYLEWDDPKITTELMKPEYEKTYAGDLFRRLVNRRLFKRVFRRRLTELPERISSTLPERFAVVRNGLESLVAAELQRLQGTSVDARHVILNMVMIDSVRKQSRNSEGSIMISKQPRPVSFEEESVLFRSIDESLNEGFVECYAPVSYEDDNQRDRLLNEMAQFVIKEMGECLK